MTGWIADELPEIAYDPPYQERGESYDVTRYDHVPPTVARPIGFMRRKPRVRVKAWTMPVLPQS